MLEKVRLICNYGELKSHIPYILVREGYDWVELRASGRVYQVPASLIDRNDYADYMEYEQYRQYEEEDE